jgi:hypothetical protein
VEFWNFVFWAYHLIAVNIFLFVISIYLVLFSHQKRIKNNNLKLLFTLVLGFILIGLNYHKFLLHPHILSPDAVDSTTAQFDFAISNYYTLALSIIALLIFWIRYYQKYFILTEYLNLVIFLFTLSNLLDALYFLIYQHEFKVFINSQIFFLFLNISMLTVWLMRISYLNKEISIENERYLKNFKYLDGLISKPKKSSLENIFISSSTHIVVAAIFIIILLVLALYFINIITFYLTINTVFILVAVIMAIYYGFSSVKRDWQNQIGFIYKEKKNK